MARCAGLRCQAQQRSRGSGGRQAAPRARRPRAWPERGGLAEAVQAQAELGARRARGHLARERVRHALAQVVARAARRLARIVAVDELRVDAQRLLRDRVALPAPRARARD